MRSATPRNSNTTIAAAAAHPKVCRRGRVGRPAGSGESTVAVIGAVRVAAGSRARPGAGPGCERPPAVSAAVGRGGGRVGRPAGSGESTVAVIGAVRVAAGSRAGPGACTVRERPATFRATMERVSGRDGSDRTRVSDLRSFLLDAGATESDIARAEA